MHIKFQLLRLFYFYSYGGVKLQTGSSTAIFMSKIRMFVFRDYDSNFLTPWNCGSAVLQQKKQF